MFEEGGSAPKISHNFKKGAQFPSTTPLVPGSKLSLNVIKTQAMTIGPKQKLSHMKQSLPFQDFISRQNIDLAN